MPCNTVQTNTVELSQLKDHDLLLRALKAEFKYVTIRGERIGTLHGNQPQVSEFIFSVDGTRVLLKDGVAASTMSESDLQKVVGRIKQAYSREVVQVAAKRFGWSLQKKGANQFQAVKR